MAAVDFAELDILLVSDNAPMRALLAGILAELGVLRVRESADSTTAIEELDRSRADMAIVDWNMQPDDGLTLARRLRGDESPDRYVPILMLAGFAERARAAEAHAAGVNEIIVAPVTAKSLQQRLAKIIERPRRFIRTKDYFGPDRRRRDVWAGNGGQVA